MRRPGEAGHTAARDSEVTRAVRGRGRQERRAARAGSPAARLASGTRARNPLAGVLPPSQVGRLLLLVALVDSAGTGAYLAGSVLYFVRAVGLSGVGVGLGMSAAGIAGLLTMVPIAALADRFGAQRALVALQTWRGAWFAAFAMVHSFAGFLAVSCLLGLANQAVPPINQAIVGTVIEPAARVRMMALTRATRNAGFGLGAAAATSVIALAPVSWYRSIVLVDALSFVITATLLARLKLPPASRPSVPGPWWHGLRPRDEPWYFALAGLNGILALHMTLLSVGLPLWIIEQTHAVRWTVGAVVFINTALAVLLQLSASRGCDTAPGAGRRARRAGLVLALCCLAAASIHALPAAGASVAALATVVVLTAGELWQSAGAWGLSYALAPADRRATYLSAFNLGVAVQTVAGPALVTSLVIAHGWAGWGGLAVTFASAGVLVPVAVNRHLSSRAGRPAERPAVLAGQPAEPE
jgi:MFS family permease